MPTEQIHEAINLLESEIQELGVLMLEWDRLSGNLNGARQYKSIVKRIVLQSQKI